MKPEQDNPKDWNLYHEGLIAIGIVALLFLMSLAAYGDLYR